MRTQFAEETNLADDVLTAFARNPVPINAFWALCYGLLVGAVSLQRFVWAQQATAGQILTTGLCTAVAITAIMLRHRHPVPALIGCLAAGLLSCWFGIGRIDTEATLITLWAVLVAKPARLAVAAWCAAAADVAVMNLLTRWQVATSIYNQTLVVLAPMVLATGLALLVRWRRYITEERHRARIEQAEQQMLTARLRIGADMHDTIGHGLTSVINLTDVALLALQHGEEQDAVDHLTRANSLARQTLAESRGVISRLRGDEEVPLTPQPGLDDLPVLLETAEQAGLSVHLRETGERPAGLLAADLYRIVQEAITNTLRHAREATQICIDLTHEPQLTTLQIVDDGRGSGSPQTGNGLAGITERVASHQGTLEYGPTPQGWQVLATLPWATP